MINRLLQTLLVATVCICAENANCQNTFAPIGTKWYYSIGSVDDQEGLEYKANCVTIEVVWDTIINGEDIRKLKVLRIHPDKSITHVSDEFIKQNGDTVFYLNQNLNQFVELYNFGLVSHDTLTVHNDKTEVSAGFFAQSVTEFSYVIDSIDSVEIDNKWLKRQHITDNYNSNSDWCMAHMTGVESNDYIIENYGSTGYLFGFTRYVTPESRPTLLRCIEYNGNIIYKNPNWEKECDYTYLYNSLIESIKSELSIGVFPNPAQNEVSIYPSNTYNYDVKIFDINGRVMWKGQTSESIDISDLPQGLYSIDILLPNDGLHQNFTFLKL